MQIKQELGRAQAHLYSVWQNLRSEGDLPHKQAIGIRDLKYFAAYYAILHLNAKGEPLVLHSGTEFDELWGRNITGCTIAEISPPRTRDLFSWFIQQLLSHPSGGVSSDTFTKKSGDKFLVNFLYLPIRKKTGDIALAVMADLKGLGAARILPNPKSSTVEDRVVHSVEFVDVGFGVPSGMLVDEPARAAALG